MFDTDTSTGTQAEYIARRTNTVGEMFLERVKRDEARAAFFFKAEGEWQPVSWTDFAARAGAIASYLMSLGLQVGDKICMVGSTGPAWCYCDMGGQIAGAITLGAYPTLTPKQLAYILDHADTKVAFVEGIEEINKILGVEEPGKDEGEKEDIPFHVGQVVEVIQGPFSDFSGTVQEVFHDKGKVKVEVSLFGRPTSVELDYTQLKGF